MKILLVGAGQLGSRHLQSCLKLSRQSTIYVVDPSPVSLDLAKDRAREIGNESSHLVHYFSDISEVQEVHIDFFILATGAQPRFNIFRLALEMFSIKYVILEKVLFQDLRSYELARRIIETSGVEVFVNCPIRMYSFFKEVKKKYIRDKSDVRIYYKGGEWIGLGCNSIHYIDLLQFFTGDDICGIDLSGLDSEIIESKRKGYVEFTGKIICNFSMGSTCQIEAIKKSDLASTIIIQTGDVEIVIDELTGNYSVTSAEESVVTDKYEIQYQSNLTHKVIEELCETGSCGLTKYEISMQLHMVFVSRLLDHVNNNSVEKTTVLNIT